MDTPLVLLVLFFSVILHECAHGWMAERHGDSTAREMGRITLNPLPHIDLVGTIIVPLVLYLLPGNLLFGWAKPVPVNPYRLRDPARAQAWIAASGPGSNLLLALVCAVLAGLMAAWGGVPAAAGPGRGVGADLHVFLYSLFYYGVFINCVLAVFNLIPIPPLDGSWLVLRWLRGPAAEAYASIRPYGVFVVILLLNFGLGSLFGRVVSAVAGSYLALAQGVARLLG